MEVTSRLANIVLRAIALVALLVGLLDAARLLGVAPGDVSPFALLGPRAFTYLAIFSAAYLFASVGLWIRASWGAVLLIGVALVQLTLYLTGSPHISMSFFGFLVRLLLLVAVAFVFGIGWWRDRTDVHD